MKKLSIIAITFLSVIACQKKENNSNEVKTFGQKFEVKGKMSKEDLAKQYQNMKSGDSIDIVFEANVKEVCKKKGCWMSMSLDDDSLKTFVRFRDYGFFVPLDADSSTVATVKGKAFVDEVSIADQKEYLKDAGKSQEEIDAVKEVKRTYSILADGVQLSRQ